MTYGCLRMSYQTLWKRRSRHRLTNILLTLNGYIHLQSNKQIDFHTISVAKCCPTLKPFSSTQPLKTSGTIGCLDFNGHLPFSSPEIKVHFDTEEYTWKPHFLHTISIYSHLMEMKYISMKMGLAKCIPYIYSSRMLSPFCKTTTAHSFEKDIPPSLSCIMKWSAASL